MNQESRPKSATHWPQKSCYRPYVNFGKVVLAFAGQTYLLFFAHSAGFVVTDVRLSAIVCLNNVLAVKSKGSADTPEVRAEDGKCAFVPGSLSSFLPFRKHYSHGSRDDGEDAPEIRLNRGVDMCDGSTQGQISWDGDIEVLSDRAPTLPFFKSMNRTRSIPSIVSIADHNSQRPSLSLSQF